MRRMYIQMIGQPPQGAGMDPAVATEAILQKMGRTKNNADFFDSMRRG
jgi:transcription termination factor Rho